MSFTHLLESGAQFFARLAGLSCGRGKARPLLCFQFLASILQPVSETQSRNAVVPVVALDGLEKIADFSLTVPKRHRRFERLKGDIRVAERHSASEAIERFKPLDGIALDRGSDALPNGAVKIDEDPGPQQFVHFIDARAVPSGQPLYGSRLVGGVVVDVHLRVLDANAPLPLL